MRYVALLRSVNVGGRSVPMAALRAELEAAGLRDVTTYIQSGNVIFSSAKRPSPAGLEHVTASRLGIDTTVVLRTAADLERAIARNPFPRADRARLHVGFMVKAPAAGTLASIDATPFAPEEFAVRGTELYLHLPNGMGRAKLPLFLDRRLGIPTTFRNWNTVTKLAELARA